jgi:hypothetical protein
MYCSGCSAFNYCITAGDTPQEFNPPVQEIEDDMKAQCRMSKVLKVRHQKSRTKSRTPFTSQSRGNSSTFLTLAQSRYLAHFVLLAKSR